MLGAMDPLKYRPLRIRQVLMRRGCTQDEADDLVQEALLRMQEYCERGGQVQKPEGFLVRTALRLAINARRDEHRELYSSSSVEELEQIVDAGPLPEEVLAADECLRRMQVALDAANRRTREIFFMHRLDGLTYAQIARRFGVSISAVEKHIARALFILTEANLDIRE